MLFRWEHQTHQFLMVFLLASSAIVAIIINQSDLSGKTKKNFFRFIYRYNSFFVIPAAAFILVTNVWGITQIEFISVASAGERVLMALAGLIILLIAIFRVLSLTKSGLYEVKRNSITASKYLKIFQRLRAAFMAIMITVALTFGITYLLL